MKILVPIDFSENAQQALRYAMALAQQLRSHPDSPDPSDVELVLYHCFHVPIGGKNTFFVSPEMLEKAEQQERNKLERLIGSLPELRSIPHRYATRLALPGEGIIQVANDESVDLIVIGLRGSDESSAGLGSTTLQVMKHVTCPVLAVPATPTNFHPKEVAFATDLKDLESTDSLKFLVKLLRIWQANLRIIHVHPHPEKIGAGSAEEALHLDHIFRDIPRTFHFPQEKKARSGITQYLQNHTVELLVIVPRYHFALENVFHDSVTRFLSGHSPVPLLAFHEELG